MPCDSIKTAKVELGKVDPALFAEAAKMVAQNCGIIARLVNGKPEIRWSAIGGLDEDRATRMVKQAYSRQVVLSQAKRYGWQVSETKPNVFQVSKR